MDFSIPPLGVIFAGVEIDVEDRLYKGIAIEGVNTYFRDERGWYYWSGRAAILYKALQAPARSVESAGPPEAEPVGGSWHLELTEPHEESPARAEEKPIAAEDTRSAAAFTPPPPSGVFVTRQAPEERPVRADAGIPPAVPNEINYQPELLHWGLEKSGVSQQFWTQEGLFGRGLKIAVLDTGIPLQHPDFDGRIAQVFNFCDADTGDVTDHDGHGTRCAGLIAGAGRKEYLGVAPQARLWVGKVMNHALDIQFDRLVQALQWALRRPIDLLFLGFDLPADKLTMAQRQQLRQLIEEAAFKGIFCIAPAGDGRSARPEDRYPACLPGCLSVGGHDADYQRLPNSLRSYSLDVVAPAAGLFPGLPGPDRSESTSYAAAFATGMIALGMEYAGRKQVALTPARWLDLVKHSATPKFRITKCNDIEYGCGWLRATDLLAAIRGRAGESIQKEQP